MGLDFESTVIRTGESPQRTEYCYPHSAKEKTDLKGLTNVPYLVLFTPVFVVPPSLASGK